MKFTNWNGQGLKGRWLFTYKIDGVQAIKKGTKITSRNGNKLYNLDALKWMGDGIYEVFCGSWNQTWSIVSASKSKRRFVKFLELYHLYPVISDRLYIGAFTNPTAELINIAFNQALALEYEGLVLRNIDTDDFIKVKPTYSEDLKITGWTEGKGKFAGMLGKFHTEAGDVGTGFTDAQRELLWFLIRHNVICDGMYIEVKAMEKFPNGKLRHPRFIRLRPDK